jgi:hypothetical protein
MRSSLRINASNNRAMDCDCFPDIRKKSVAMCRDVKSAASCFAPLRHIGTIEWRTDSRLQFVQFNPKDQQSRQSRLVE